MCIRDSARTLGREEEELRLLQELEQEGISQLALRYRLAELQGSNFEPPPPLVNLTTSPKLRRKVNRTLNSHVAAYLKDHGFRQSAEPLDYIKVENGVLLAVNVETLKKRSFLRSSGPLAGGTFAASVGISYASLFLDGGQATDFLEDRGIAITELRGLLTRTAATNCHGPNDVWDPGQLSPEGAVDDLIAAIESQAWPLL